MTDKMIDCLTDGLGHQLKHLPFAVEYISTGINTDPAVELRILHHHIWLSRVVTVGVW